MNVQKSKRQTEGASSRTYFLLLALLKGAMAAVLLGVVLSLVAAAVAYASPDPDAWILPLGLAVLALCATAGGCITRTLARVSPLLCGLSFGLVLLALTFILSYLPSQPGGDRLSSTLSWGVRGGVLLFSVLGALMGELAPRRKRKKRKKRK